MSWAIKLNSAQTVHVCFYNSFEALAFWLEYVSIESKAVTCSSMVWLDACSETIGWDLFITIIVLKDISNSFECLQIFVSLKVLAMQRSWCVWLAIWQSKVYGDAKVNLTASKHILQKVCLPLQLEVLDTYLRVFERIIGFSFLQLN